MWPQPGSPLCRERTLRFRREFFAWLRLLDGGKHRREFLFEPGMQDRVGHREHAFGVEDARGWPKEGEQFGGAPALVLMGLHQRMPLRLPRGPRLRDSLIRPGFIFVELHDARGFRLLICELDQSFFSFRAKMPTE